MAPQADLDGVDRRKSKGNPGGTTGERIRFWRLQHSWSQEALAKKVNATQAAVSQWENDEWIPSRQSQRSLSAVFELPRNILIAEEDVA